MSWWTKGPTQMGLTNVIDCSGVQTQFALASPVQWTESVNGWNLDLNHNAKVLLGSDGSFKYNAEKKWNKNLTFNLTAHVDLNNWKKTNLGNLGFGVTYE